MNGYLLDTNALLFLAFKTDSLALSRVEPLADAPRYVSQVSAIEIAIKHGLGKLTLPPSYRISLASGFRESARELAAEIINIDLAHIERLGSLPRHHGDPFDRLMISQAIVEDLTVVTRDRAFSLYAGLAVYEI